MASTDDVVVSYNNAEIASMTDSGTKTLETGGKYCADDITITYTKSGGGSTPKTCTVTIDENHIVCSNFSNGAPSGTYVAVFNISDRDWDEETKGIGVFVATGGVTDSADTENGNSAFFLNDTSTVGFLGYVVGYSFAAYSGNDWGDVVTDDLMYYNVFDIVGTYTATVIEF